MAKPMLISVKRSFRAGWLPGRLSESMIAVSHELLSLVSDNLLYCLIGSSFYYYFLKSFSAILSRLLLWRFSP